jgi:hypothetical protein
VNFIAQFLLKKNIHFYEVAAKCFFVFLKNFSENSVQKTIYKYFFFFIHVNSTAFFESLVKFY